MLIMRYVKFKKNGDVENLLITCSFLDGNGHSTIAHLVMDRFQFRKNTLFYGTFSFVVSNPGTLLCLHRIMRANIHKCFNDIIKRVNVVVKEDQLARILGLVFMIFNRFDFFFDHE